MRYFSVSDIDITHLILLLGLLLSSSCQNTADAATIVIGKNEQEIGWTEGVCYIPIRNVNVGDKVVFEYGGHNIYKMESESSFLDCDFEADGVTLLAGTSESPFAYTVTEDDRRAGNVYFSCGVGSHCAIGQQKVRLIINEDDYNRDDDPISRFLFGVNENLCKNIQLEIDEDAEFYEKDIDSSCSDPLALEIDEKGHQWFSRSCLSAAMTMTPGGIINQATNVYYPYPTDRRVIVGDRIWEFVEGDPEQDGGLNPVNINQLYIHHTLGGVITGNGAESARQRDEDAAFTLPYGKLSGNYDTFMTYHIIDLREVSHEDFLGCVECRCAEGTYTYDPYFVAKTKGGIGCCTNCTALTTPTVDYRLRYNVTYMDIPQGMYVEPVHYITGDIARALGNAIEFDVPHFTELPEDQQHPDDPKIQVVEFKGPLRHLFQEGIVDGTVASGYTRSNTLKIHRITGHLHIGGLEMYIEDLESGEIIHTSRATYGTDPDVDEGFITSMGVTNYDPPMILSAERKLRLVTHYDASDTDHLGVMGLFTMWFSEGGDDVVQVGPNEARLTIDYCLPDVCNASRFPDVDSLSVCVDTIGDSILCKRSNVCSCKTFLDLPTAPGCGDNIGDFTVYSFCAKTCDSCESEREEAIINEMIVTLDNMCYYPTSDCENYLSNMDACVEGKPGFESLHEEIQNVFTKKGRWIIDEYSRFGHPSLHRGNVNGNKKEEDGCTTTTSAAWTMHIEMFHIFYIIVYFAL